MLLLVDDVRIGAGSHHHRSRRERNLLAGVLPFAVHERHAGTLERSNMIVIIQQAGNRTHTLREADAFFKRLDHLFVIEPIGRRIL